MAGIPSPTICSRVTSTLSSFKVKLATCKKAVARFRTRPFPSSDNQRPANSERRHVQGLGYIKADVAPRRSRRAATEAKYGNRSTSNEIVRASDIITIGGFAYDRAEADSMGIHIAPPLS